MRLNNLFLQFKFNKKKKTKKQMSNSILFGVHNWIKKKTNLNSFKKKREIFDKIIQRQQ